MREKGGANTEGALRRNTLTPVRVWFYFEGVKSWGITAFKGTIRKVVKVLAILTLALRNVLMTLAIPTFLVRMSL
jgi:hypothetical protein